MSKMQKLENFLQQHFGFGFFCESRTEDGYPVIYIRLSDLKPPHGFSVKVKLGWRSLELRFVQDNFSRHFIQNMAAPDIGKIMVSASFLTALKKYGGSLVLKINGSEISPDDVYTWPTDWTTFELNYDRFGVDLELAQFLDGRSESFRQCLDYLGIIVSLLPVEESSHEEPLERLPEGMPVREEVNRYERNRLNREACIAVKGTTCTVCRFNFAEAYGDLGEGFIHVHHVIPVSQLGEGYVVDPSKDLVPVCANCHSMLHRKDPPLRVDELKQIITNRGCS